MFDFSGKALEAKLPAAGTHQAAITDVSVSEGEDATYLKVEVELETKHTLGGFWTIDAPETSVRVADVPAGTKIVQSLAEATNTDISTLREPSDIENAFVGAAVAVVVAHRKTGGVKRATIKRFVAPTVATAPAAAPAQVSIQPKGK